MLPATGSLPVPALLDAPARVIRRLPFGVVSSASPPVFKKSVPRAPRERNWTATSACPAFVSKPVRERNEAGILDAATSSRIKQSGIRMATSDEIGSLSGCCHGTVPHVHRIFRTQLQVMQRQFNARSWWRFRLGWSRRHYVAVTAGPHPSCPAGQRL